MAAAPDSIAQAREALLERNLSPTDENIFLVAASIVPGRNMELNEGIRLLTGNARITLPLKAQAPAEGDEKPSGFTERVTTTCKIEENGRTREFRVTIDPPAQKTPDQRSADQKSLSGGGEAVPVYSPFDGKVEVVEIRVKAGDAVRQGQIVAAVEAMKANHDVKSPCDGLVKTVDVALGATVARGTPIITLTR